MGMRIEEWGFVWNGIMGICMEWNYADEVVWNGFMGMEVWNEVVWN